MHERDLDIDFSLVVIKHLLVKENEGFNFKLILMSATFNIELFANYFSKSSIHEIEKVEVYVGIEEQMKQQEIEKEKKLREAWGPCKKEDWNVKDKALKDRPNAGDEDEEDEWVENQEIV